jgi:nitroimidazol reductase NimA-like FMN-containing flavoprotein (pyridoxamine 5'-phosphate oxidase superfamily)
LALPGGHGRNKTWCMVSAERSLVALSRRECVALLAGAQVGRAVFTERAMPAVVPVTFAVHDDAVVMCTAPDTRLASAATRGVLAFEVDEIDPSTRCGWSVVVIGVADLVNDPLERACIRSVLQPWAPGKNDVFIRLPLAVVTGRRIWASDESEYTATGR